MLLFMIFVAILVAVGLAWFTRKSDIERWNGGTNPANGLKWEKAEDGKYFGHKYKDADGNQLTLLWNVAK